ncbi:MAG TPA: TonB-dependent receptor [Bacteroides togonis]|nr:TonB-dependent receptor [Bacteroides togonis]
MDYLSNSRRKGRNVNSFLAFLLFVCMSVMPVMAQQDKNVTLNVKNETVENVLKSLGQQTGLKFFYDQNVVNVSPRVTLQASGASLQSVLNQISSQTQLSFNRNNNTITVGTLKAGGTDNQKKMKVTGVVVDANGEPIIGANVWVKGTTSGVITNVDGNFVIDAPLHSVLTVSYIGFLAQDIEVKDSKALRVVIQEDTQKLEEVVVIGYGTMKKKDLMGANTGVSGDNLAASSNISVGGALQGKMSGISIMNSGGFPGAETSINIRGIGTFGSGDSAPLIVIDGVPVDQGFETLNPNDIESVNVLKDASSAAIYGSRAANGVILVTTKKGASGKATVSMNATFGIQSPMHMMDLLDASEFVAAIQEMRDNYNAIYKPSTPAVTNYDGLDPESFGKGTNWGDYIYQSAPTYNINASVSGGSDNMNYYLSGEFLNQEGIAINTAFKKASLRANVEGKINKRLTVGNNVHMAYRYTQGDAGNRYSDVIFNAPITPAYDEDGSYGEPDASLTGSKNAIAEVAWNCPTNSNYRVMDNLFLEYKFTDWLKFRFNGGIDMVYNEYKLFKPKFNDGGQTNEVNSYTEERSKDFMWVTDYLLYFDKTFGDHTINAMAGFSQQLFSYDNMRGSIKNFVSEVGNMHVFDGGTDTKERELSGGKTELALASYFGRINYDFKGRYLFSFNLRADGSSRFKAGNRWGVFPSFSGAWRISEESFFHVKPISSLKIRASWGQLGNQSIGSYYPTVAAVGKQNAVFGTAADNQTLYAGYSQTALGNRSLKWETTTVTNVGIDMTLFNNALSVTADYFIKNTDGILRTMVLPISVGLTAPNMNYAEVQNRGFELELGYNGKVRDFHYNVSGNVSFLHNEIRKLSSGVNEEIIDIGCYGGVTINRVGEPISALYGYRTAGVITTEEEAAKYQAMGQGNARVGRLKYVDADGNGKIDGDDRVILGSYIPKVAAGLTLSADWKGFDFSTVFTGVFGRTQHAPMSYQNRFPNRNISRKWYDNRWTLGSPAGDYPAMIQSESYEEMTDLMAMNTSYVKMKSITLGYTHRFSGMKARIFLSGENLFAITSDEFDGFDPENGTSVGHYTNWGDDFPTPRILLVGLNLTF